MKWYCDSIILYLTATRYVRRGLDSRADQNTAPLANSHLYQLIDYTSFK